MLPYLAKSKFELKGIAQITSNLQFVSNVNQKEKRNDFDSHFGAFSCHNFYVELIV